jgi:hypothetical protein
MWSQEFDEQEAKIAKFERELAAQKEQLRLCNVDQFSTAAELAEQKEQFRVLEDELLVLGDERNAAVKDAKENMEIANEFKLTMEEYRQRAEAAYVESARLVKMLALADEQIKENVKALKVAVEMLSSQYYCDSSPAEVLKHLITKAKEMK